MQINDAVQWRKMFWVAAGPVNFTIHASGLTTTDIAKQKNT